MYYTAADSGLFEALHNTYFTGSLIPVGDNHQAFVRTVQKSADGSPEKQLVILIRSGFFEQILRDSNVFQGVFALLSEEGTILSVDAGDRRITNGEVYDLQQIKEDAEGKLFSGDQELYTY